MDYQALGRRVFDRRRSLGLSQEVLAQRADISRNYVSLIERGEAQNISMNIINQLSTALGISPSELMGQSEAYNVTIPPALREFGLHENLSFEVVDRLARIPRRGQEPQSASEWDRLYQAIRPYLEETD